MIPPPIRPVCALVFVSLLAGCPKPAPPARPAAPLPAVRREASPPPPAPVPAVVRPVTKFTSREGELGSILTSLQALDETALHQEYVGEKRGYQTRAENFERALETAAARWQQAQDEPARTFGVRACRAALGELLEASDEALRARVSDRGSADPQNLLMRDAAYHFALLHYFTQDRAPARRAAVLLLRLAEQAAKWPLYNPSHQEPKTAFAQDDPAAFKDEYCAGLWGSWLYSDLGIGAQTVGRAYDLIYDAGVMQELQALAAIQSFLRRHADLTIRAVGFAGDDNGSVLGFSNMDAYALTGLLDLAKILDAPEYVHRAVWWVKALYQTQFYADGWWHEGAVGYHTMIQWQLRGICHDRLQGYSDPPGYLDQADGTRFDHLDIEREVGGAVSRADRLLVDLIQPNGTFQTIHDTPANFKAWDFLPRPERALSALHGCAGHAVLGNGATGTQNMSYVSLHFGGTHGHEHFDCLNLTLFAHGRELISETNYHPPEGVTNTTRDWHTMTAGHTTVVVDGLSQTGRHDPSTPKRDRQPQDAVAGYPDWPCRWFGQGNVMNDGRLRLFQTDFDRVQVVEADGERSYHNVAKLERYRRTIALVKIDDSDVYVVDVFRVKGGSIHDYMLHSCLDAPHSVAVSVPLTEQKEGFLHKYITGIRSARTGGDWTATFRMDDGSALLRTWILGATGTEILAGDGPAMRRAGTAPFLAVRRTGGESVYVAVHHPYVGKPLVQKVERLKLAPADGQAVALRVTLPDRVDTIIVTADESPWILREVVAGGVKMRGRFAHVAQGKGVNRWAYLVDGDRLDAGDLRIAGDSSHSGVLTRTSRIEAGDPENAFITPADLPADGTLDGRTLMVDLGGLLVQSFRITRVERRGDETIIHTLDEPGMTLSPNLVKLEYFPGWGITGEAKFRIPGSALTGARR